MSREDLSSHSLYSIEAQAARWLARRDRGLTAAERDEYLGWLRQDPRHCAAVARLEPTLERMEQLAFWQPSQSSEPNPDLFAPQRGTRRLRWSWMAGGLAAAASILVGFATHWWALSPAAKPPIPHLATSHLRVNERKLLPDGSVVELKDGSQMSVEFTDAERRVRLSGGEAHFTVAKNLHRPFVVEARMLAVRAVGTVFDVRLDLGSVAVLVTEGKVKVQEPASTGLRPGPKQPELIVAAGQCTAVSQDPVAPAPKVTSVSGEEIKEMLSLEKEPRLQFHETALADAVAEFNLHNRRQMILADRELGSIPIGGIFRVDNVDGFVHLLEVTLGIQAAPHGADELLLTRSGKVKNF